MPSRQYSDWLPPCWPFFKFQTGVRAGEMLGNLLNVVPELSAFANLHLEVAFNKDSSRVGPVQWQQLAQLLHRNRSSSSAQHLSSMGLEINNYCVGTLAAVCQAAAQKVQCRHLHWRPVMSRTSDASQQLSQHGSLSSPALLQAEVRRLSGRAWHGHHGLHSICSVPHAAGLQEAHRHDRSAACTAAHAAHPSSLGTCCTPLIFGTGSTPDLLGPSCSRVLIVL